MYLLLLSLLAADPKLTGPTQFPRDSIAVFRVENPPAKGPVFWSVTPRPGPGQSIKRGAELELALPPGRYEVGAMCWDANTNQQTELQLSTSVVEGGGPVPGPVDPNPPGPGPKPPVPAPVDPKLTGTALFAYKQAAALPPAAKLKAATVAGGLRGVSSAIVAGTLSSLKIPGATRTAWDAAVGDQKVAWAPVDVALQTELRRLASSGAVKTAADLAAAMNDAATGFEAVK